MNIKFTWRLRESKKERLICLQRDNEIVHFPSACSILVLSNNGNSVVIVEHRIGIINLTFRAPSTCVWVGNHSIPFSYICFVDVTEILFLGFSFFFYICIICPSFADVIIWCFRATVVATKSNTRYQTGVFRFSINVFVNK